ncbi:bromodomain-containing factor 1 [Oryza brachyantha]|uniref:Bromo domain-containing protein n=1 Tax=Oryza brachyantha TaxID=4533 RepID=J3MPQ1_ORYBR|nr:bromodomain-containing factor 1 [Oryza brachyantha]XP_015696194.1 bromodomain-containing factor 1 [Oryza brachyantha]XP_015696195.1 bromodomain-containing factor 1 [Oryza brachyantha]
MKRKRARKVGKKAKSKTATADASPNSLSSPSTIDASPKSPSSPSTEENDISPAHQADDPPVIAPPGPEPAPPEPEKPAAPADVQSAKPKVYSRVRLKFKSAKVLETHQSSSEAKAPADATGKPASAAPVPEANKEVAEKATVSPDGQKDVQTSDLSSSDKDKVARKISSIKIKSAGLSSMEDKNQDRKTDSVIETLPSKQETVLENGESETALEPRSPQELEVKEATPERQRDDKELTAALEAIKKVMKMDAAEPFNTPVDPVALGIPDYFDIIDTPMDFGTICKNLERGDKYMNSEDVYKDVQFIWDNCTKYNSKGDYIIELMKRVKKGFMKNWLAADLYSDFQENGGNDNTGDEDVKGNSKGKSKQKRRRLGNDRHKNDCACAVCQVTRRKKEKDEILAVIENETAAMNSNISDQQIMEVDSGNNNPGSHDTTSSQEQLLQTDSGIQIENPVKFFNSQTLRPDYEDEGSRQYFEEKEEVDYTDLISQEEHTSSQPNDGSEVAQHQHKETTETSQEIEMEDYPIQQQNNSFLQLCAQLFPSNSQSSVFRGRHSLFRQQQRQVSIKESPLHAAITSIMKR